jgi:hypothetical protein
MQLNGSSRILRPSPSYPLLQGFAVLQGAYSKGLLEYLAKMEYV